MSRTVFIVGAGASAEAGGPIMSNCFDKADALRQAGQTDNAAASFALVFKALHALNAAHAKASIDVDNLEEVFGAFEMARLTAQLAGLNADELRELTPALRRVIVTTLDRSIQYPVSGDVVSPPQPYGRFGQIIQRMLRADFGPISFITLNYDIALDYMLHHYALGTDYCFGAPQAGHMPLMKLHGSVNWARCRVCGQVIPWHLSDFFRTHTFQVAMMLHQSHSRRFPFGTTLAEFRHCDQPCVPDAVIVPPTWNKAQYQEVGAVWEHAARHLSEAENIFVIGYSLPRTDQFFRYLYSVGSIGDARIKRFWVIDPAKPVGERFDELLGPTTRGRFQHLQGTFGRAISELMELAPG